MGDMQMWFSAREIAEAKLPGMPTNKANILLIAQAKNWPSREHKGRGGGQEYPLGVLPLAAQAVMALRQAEDAPKPRAGADAQAWFDQLPKAKRDKALAKLQALEAVEAMIRTGMPKVSSMHMVAARIGVQTSTLYAWEATAMAWDRRDWAVALAPRHRGASAEAECEGDAWEVIKGDWLRPEKPSFTACYRRLQAVALEKGWTIPAARTLERRLLALPEGVRVLAREGIDKLKRMYPAQERDRGVFHALEAVNVDGHKWDVAVRWPDGTIGRPMMVAFQDLYSGKMLSWRVDRAETWHAVRLAFGDLVEGYGVPDQCWLDNGRAFASKWITGKQPTRYRFKIREDDPEGLLTQLGVQAHWTKPYSGQSKPIERAFRDFAGDIAKHPAFAGAYLGNSPVTKPANYGNAAVDSETFLRIIAAGIAEHNARTGRQSRVCQGRSFDQVFAESYATSLIRRPSEHQRRLWLLAAESVLVSRTDGSITLMGNRYWAEALHAWRGQRLIVRFDPDAMHDDLHVYRPDDGYLCAAPVIDAVGFADAAAARKHEAERKRWLKGAAMQLAAERSMTIDQVAAILPQTEAAPPPPPPRLVRMMNGPALPVRAPDLDEQPEDERTLIAAVHQLRLVRNQQEEDLE